MKIKLACEGLVVTDTADGKERESLCEHDDPGRAQVHIRGRIKSPLPTVILVVMDKTVSAKELRSVRTKEIDKILPERMGVVERKAAVILTDHLV